MIESKNNQQIRNLIKLRKQSKERRKQKAFLVEGIRMFQEVPADKLVKAYATPEFYELHKELFEGKDFELVEEKIFKEISDTVTPQGVLAIVKQMDYSLEDLLNLEENPCFLILENLQDPGNLGTIIRTGEGAGVTAVIMNKETVDMYNPKVIRSTMGSIYRVPFVYVENLSETLHILKENQIATYAAHLNGKNFYDYDFKTACAFLIGNEGNGLTDEITKQADHYIKIPMQGKVESLNAAIAATVLVYESMRQRL